MISLAILKESDENIPGVSILSPSFDSSITYWYLLNRQSYQDLFYEYR